MSKDPILLIKTFVKKEKVGGTDSSFSEGVSNQSYATGSSQVQVCFHQ